MDLTTIEDQLRAAIRDVPDFPRRGILFKDVTTLLHHPQAFRTAIHALCAPFRADPPDHVVGIESRGFPFGAAMSYELGCGMILARKPGKLPAETESITYQLEYGEDALEIHRDAVVPGQRLLVVDDLLATGGTAGATVDLARRLGADVVGLAVLIELQFLDGRGRIEDLEIHSVLKY
jgi:adenine phosphoribosyltransferase